MLRELKLICVCVCVCVVVVVVVVLNFSRTKNLDNKYQNILCIKTTAACLNVFCFQDQTNDSDQFQEILLFVS